MQIYLDNSATTKICKEALDVYTRVSLDSFGNPSSLHGIGHAAERVTDEAREHILRSIGARGAHVVFTASGSEANNLAITGRAQAKERYERGARIITSAGEHASVTEPLARLASRGFTTVEISTRGGEIDMGELERALTPDTILVTVMLVNNETGAVYNIPEVARLVHSRCRDALLHVDATQGYMKIPFTLPVLGADLLTLSSHKIEGPKGVGALVYTDRVARERAISPIIFGGGQEGGMRSGTENVPGIAAFGEAARIGAEKIRERVGYMESLRERIVNRLSSDPELSAIDPTLPPEHAPHILNVTLPGIKSETMLHFLSSKGIYVSSGSACSSNSRHISGALVAYGRSESEADCSIRISLSHRNTEEEADALCDALAEGVANLARVRR